MHEAPARELRHWLQGWRTFVHNHADALASIDMFLVPTISFGLLYGLLILRQSRRELLWLGVPTVNPKQLSIACESVDNHRDGRSPEVDLVRRGRAVPVARSLANGSSRPSASAQCAEA
jgi:hypothetical protein